MDTILSLLGLILSTLLSIPSRKVSITDAKKSMVAKEFVSFFELLDIIIKRGYKILSTIEKIANTSETQEFRTVKSQLLKLLKQQIESVLDVKRVLGDWFEFPGEVGDLLYRENDFFQKPTNVKKILSIYEPDLGGNLQNVIYTKRHLLEFIVSVLTGKNQDGEINSILIKDITYLDPFLINDSYGSLIERLDDLEQRGLVKYREFNLSDPKERGKYILRTRKRLKEIEKARDQLAHLIKELFNPHEII